MNDLDRHLHDFMEAYGAGERPDVLAYLERVPEGAARAELAELISTWVELAPAPAVSGEARAAAAASPRVALALAALREEAGAWPALLPQLRERRGMAIRDLAARVVKAFGFAAADEPRAAAYLEQMERGTLGAGSVSRRLLDVLGDALGTSGASLFDAGGGLRPARAGGALFRTEGDAATSAAAIDALSRAAFTPAPADPPDELDALFLGGPEA